MFMLFYTREASRVIKRLKKEGLAREVWEFQSLLRNTPFEESPGYERIDDEYYARPLGTQHKVVYKVVVKEHEVGGLQLEGTVTFWRVEETN